MHHRTLAWLRRHRYLDERPAEDRSNEPVAGTPIDALARLALAGGTFVGRPFPAFDRAGDEDLFVVNGAGLDASRPGPLP